MTEPNPSRVAIKFGASSSNGPKKPSHAHAKPTSALGKRQRNHFNVDSDSDGEESDVERHENITHFGANGAEFVIEERPRRDQRRNDKRENPGRRKEDNSEDARHEKDTASEDGHLARDEPIKFGLTVVKKGKEEKGANSDNFKDQDTASSQPTKSADEEAIDALLGKGADSGRSRVLIHRTEDDAFRDSKAYNTDVDDMQTYDDHPVEGFGEALLKGQGWDGKMRGPKAKEVVKRPNLIGLGAKRLNADEDLGGWQQKGRNGKRPRLDEYRRESDRERSKREDRHRDSYKNERDRNRDRDRDGDGHRDRDRDRDGRKHRDRDYRR